jgi:hypothetical protein
MMPLDNAPLRPLHTQVAVRRRILDLKRSRDSEASAERSEMSCTNPADLVHKVTIEFSTRVSFLSALCCLTSRSMQLSCRLLCQWP